VAVQDIYFPALVSNRSCPIMLALLALVTLHKLNQFYLCHSHRESKHALPEHCMH